MNRIGIALLLGMLALSPGLALAQESHSLEQVLVEMANTKEEHAALAGHYLAKANEARAEAKNHFAMAAAYRGGKVAERMQMESHCKKIADQLNATAKEYEALAYFHDAEAKKAQ